VPLTRCRLTRSLLAPPQFGLYGEPVVSACVQTGCDYVDITGEPLVRSSVRRPRQRVPYCELTGVAAAVRCGSHALQFMDRMFVKYHRAAKEADALIVPACGFDCIPNDVGVEYTRQQFPDPNLVSVRSVCTTPVADGTKTWINNLIVIIHSAFGASPSEHRELLHHVRGRVHTHYPVLLVRRAERCPVFPSRACRRLGSLGPRAWSATTPPTNPWWTVSVTCPS